MPAYNVSAPGAQAAFRPDGGTVRFAVGAIGDTFAGTIRLEIEHNELPGQWFQVGSWNAPAIGTVEVPLNRQCQLRFNATAWTSGTARCVLQP
jgi:hypothetical protein